MKLALGVLAKDEESRVAQLIRSLAAQTLLSRNRVETSFFLAANGCNDRTADVAQEAADMWLGGRGINTTILRWEQPGKSRSWNRLIHQVMPDDVDLIIMMDADITLIDNFVLDSIVDHLSSHPEVQAVSGNPVKRFTSGSSASVMNRFSILVSQLTGPTRSINGSLYVARSSCLKEIWLPDETPGEDGFLDAMVRTRGFSTSARSETVSQVPTPTHFFEGHGPTEFLAHEKRMIVGTMINRWVFEYLHALQLNEPAGHLIDTLNRENPRWVQNIISDRTKKAWVIPRGVILRRLKRKRRGRLSHALRAPVLIAATLLSLPSALISNRALKKRGVSSFW